MRRCCAGRSDANLSLAAAWCHCKVQEWRGDVRRRAHLVESDHRLQLVCADLALGLWCVIGEGGAGGGISSVCAGCAFAPACGAGPPGQARSGCIVGRSLSRICPEHPPCGNHGILRERVVTLGGGRRTLRCRPARSSGDLSFCESASGERKEWSGAREREEGKFAARQDGRTRCEQPIR